VQRVPPYLGGSAGDGGGVGSGGGSSGSGVPTLLNGGDQASEGGRGNEVGGGGVREGFDGCGVRRGDQSHINRGVRKIQGLATRP